jgi:lipid A 4'-phosphatase
MREAIHFGRPLLWAALLPLGLLLVASVALDLTTLDVFITQSCYDRLDEWFPARDAQTCSVLYRFGCYPGLILGIGGLVIAVVGLVVPGWRRAGKYGLVLAAILLVGPGLVVNTLLKPNWGRPRPDDTVRFGGTKAFCPFWPPGNDSDGHSFPSGHASMGFCLMAPGFLLWQRRRRLAVTLICLGIGYGVVMGLCRVVQGRHFASDVLWAGAIVYFTCLLFYALFVRRSGEQDEAGWSQTRRTASAT